MRAHFTYKNFINAPDPISVALIGAGGTGSQVLTCLARMNHALNQLDHPGIYVRLIDPDIVTDANLGRQLFAQSEVGIHKSVVLINKVNRFFGTNWSAHKKRFQDDLDSANVIISCVDTAAARIELSECIRVLKSNHKGSRDELRYWMDFGNARTTGQVILSTVGEVKQPNSEKFEPIGKLPFITDEFAHLLAQEDEDTPSCSLAEALQKQDLFINSALAQLGAGLLWKMFREGMIMHRGFFLNMDNFSTNAISV